MVERQRSLSLAELFGSALKALRPMCLRPPRRAPALPPQTMPMVRMNRRNLAFCCAKTCSTRAQTIGPDIRCGIVVRHDLPEHSAIKARSIGDLALADEAERAADSDTGFVAEAGDGGVNLRLAVYRRAALGELERPACIRVLLRRARGFVGPDLCGSLAFLDRRLLQISSRRLGRGHQGCIDDLPADGEIAAL